MDFNESSQGPVISPFHVIGKEAGGELFHAPVILDAFAADAFTTARVIGAVAILEIFIFLTFFHDFLR
jgi:hypothetical protein